MVVRSGETGSPFPLITHKSFVTRNLPAPSIVSGMEFKKLICVAVGHWWKQVHEDSETVYLQCRRCGKVEPLADRPMGGYMGGG